MYTQKIVASKLIVSISPNKGFLLQQCSKRSRNRNDQIQGEGAYGDPVRVLKLFNEWCKKHGVILLFEHEASKYKLFYWLQNRFDNLQYPGIGCHANRKILSL